MNSSRGAGMYVTHAWNSTMRLVVADARVLSAAADDFDDLLERADRIADGLRPDSELSRVNALAGRPLPLSPLLTKLVAAALDAAQQTGGAVDPTLSQEVATSERPRYTWRDVRLDRAAGLLMAPRGVSLDLSATANAYIADHAASALAHQHQTAVLVELGGDIAVAGRRPEGWNVAVAEREGEAGQLVRLRHGGLTTSSTVKPRRRDATVHRILDPATGRSADGPWRTASVHAPRALAANVASTAALVLGEAAPQWLVARNLAARLVDRNGRVITIGGWPEQGTAGRAAS